jgi:hypothetical protein
MALGNTRPDWRWSSTLPDMMHGRHNKHLARKTLLGNSLQQPGVVSCETDAKSNYMSRAARYAENKKFTGR